MEMWKLRNVLDGSSRSDSNEKRIITGGEMEMWKLRNILDGSTLGPTIQGKRHFPPFARGSFKINETYRKLFFRRLNSLYED